MKKKAKSAAQLARRKNPKPPGKVGGRNANAKLDWAKVGRTRNEDDQRIAQLGSELKSLRESQGLSVTKVAKELEVAPATLIKFEDTGHPISIRVVSLLAKRLGAEIKVASPKAPAKKKKAKRKQKS